MYTGFVSQLMGSQYFTQFTFLKLILNTFFMLKMNEMVTNKKLFSYSQHIISKKLLQKPISLSEILTMSSSFARSRSRQRNIGVVKKKSCRNLS